MVTSLASRGLRRLSGIVSATRRRRDVKKATRHLSGPSRISLAPNDIVLVSLMKDAAYYLGPFLAHYRRIGVEHFLIIDNGSTDGTPERLAEEPDVTVCSNTLPVGQYEILLRGQIARHYVSGGWFLFADSDELILPAHGETRQISEFAEYCNIHGYDGAICQVLDLFSSHPLQVTKDWSYADSVAAFDLYSLNEIDSFSYDDRENIQFSWYFRDNRLSNTDIRFMFGGIRREVFGENCCLTTHRFVRNASHIEIYSHPHCSNNLTCADFTFLIKHYKFAGNIVARDLAHIANQTWNHGEDKARMSILRDADGFVISGRQVQRFHSTEQLVDSGFLACSPRFQEHFPRRTRLE